MTWASQIENDLRWRETELGSLKLAATSAPDKSDRKRALLRALWALLYAHYEGFSKFCWELLLQEIEKEGCTRAQAIECISNYSLIEVFRKFRGNTSAIGINDFIATIYPREMNSRIVFPERLETSNLWPDVARKHNAALGLVISNIENYSRQLYALVNRRNEIAHGEKVVVDTLAEYQVYEKAVMVVLHELAVETVSALDGKTYLRVSTDETAIPIFPSA